MHAARVAGANLAIASAITLLFYLSGSTGPNLRHITAYLAVGLIVGLPCQLAIPVLTRRPFQRRWMRFAVAITGSALIGAAASLAAVFAVLALWPAPMSAFAEVAEGVVPVATFLAVAVTLIGTLLGESQWRIEHAERLAAEARLASLESRLHPHFLFNTLNSILALIPESPLLAERMVEQVAAILRASLDSTPQSVHTLERELKLVRDYLEIEQVRFGTRLSFQLPDLDPADAKLLVPAFALQVLVENSVQHGFAHRPEGGRIDVEVERSQQHVRIVVRDDGPGFHASQITPGHALDTLRARLQVLHGDAARLQVGPPGRGSVELKLPAQENG